MVLPLLTLLPAAGSLPVRWRSPAVALVVLAALLAWCWAIAHRAPPETIALAAKSRGQIGAWELYLLALAGVTAVAYAVVGSRFAGLTYADGAYYYGVARHMALTGRFEEPIVWHFLQPPETIVHAPFDYWGCMTTLLLVPALAVFGATPAVAILAMAAISAAAVLAFWYLICVALPLRHHVTQLIALVLFAFSPAMNLYRFQPESVAVAQLFILLSLIAFCRRWFIASLLLGFCIWLTRGDGLVLFALILLAVLLETWKHADGSRRPWHIGLVGVACLGAYVLWSLVSFGTLTPPATERVPFLKSYWQVYEFGVPLHYSWSDMLRRFTVPYIVDRIRLGVDSLRAIPIVPALDWWLVLAILGAPVRSWQRARAQRLIWLLGFAGYLVVAIISGEGFAPVRTPYTFTPLVVLAGALGVDAALARLELWMSRGAVPVRALLVGAVVFAFTTCLLGRVPILEGVRYQSGATVAIQRTLPALDDVLHGEPVASNRPWDIIAYTRSPSVSIPSNGDAAVEAVLGRYRVGWLVVFRGPRPNAEGRVLERLSAAGGTDLGQFRIDRVPLGANDPAVYSVRSIAGPVR